jgi:hypothetical protein
LPKIAFAIPCDYHPAAAHEPAIIIPQPGNNMRNLPSRPPESIDDTRRSLLRAGLFGSLLLGGAGIGATLSGCSGRGAAAAAGYRALRDADLVLLRALFPALLTALPTEGAAREALVQQMLQSLDLSCYRLGHPTRKAVLQLFDLLNLGLTRRLLAGVGDWASASPQQVQAFLERWRTSSFGVLNSGYRALVKLVSSAYYGTHAGWAAANYPGPPPGPFQVFNS